MMKIIYSKNSIAIKRIVTSSTIVVMCNTKINVNTYFFKGEVLDLESKYSRKVAKVSTRALSLPWSYRTLSNDCLRV